MTRMGQDGLFVHPHTQPFTACTACCLREAVNGSQQLPLFTLQLLPGSLLLQHLLLLYLTQHHLSPAGKQQVQQNKHSNTVV